MSTARPSQRDQLRRLWVLIAVAFVDMIGFMLVLPLLPFYAIRMNASPVQVGWILAAFSIAQLVSAPLWGRVSDRFGRRPALLIGLLASAIAYVVFGFAHTLWLLFMSRFVQGAGGGTTGVAQAYVADTIRPADRARALGWLSSATSAGVVVGPMIGTFAGKLGQAAPGFIAAALCIANALFAWYWLPESRPALPAGAPLPPRRPVWAPAWQVLREPGSPVAQLIWTYGVGMLAFAGLTSVLPLFFHYDFGVDQSTWGYYLTYFGALSVVMRIVLLGPIVDRLGERWTMRTGCLVLIVGLVLYPLVHDLHLLTILVVPLVPVGTALLFPSTTSLISARTPQHELGVTMGVAQTFGGIARAVAPVASTKAFEAIGHGSPFYLAAAIVGVVSVIAFRIGPMQPFDATPVPDVPVAT